MGLKLRVWNYKHLAKEPRSKPKAHQSHILRIILYKYGQVYIFKPKKPKQNQSVLKRNLFFTQRLWSNYLYDFVSFINAKTRFVTFIVYVKVKSRTSVFRGWVLYVHFLNEEKIFLFLLQ